MSALHSHPFCAGSGLKKSALLPLLFSGGRAANLMNSLNSRIAIVVTLVITQVSIVVR